MKFTQAVADAFRRAPSDQKVDRYGILSPLLATGEYVTSTKALMNLLSTPAYRDVLKGYTKPTNPHQAIAVDAYHSYLKLLPNPERNSEVVHPLWTIVETLDTAGHNLTHVEDDFQNLFGNVNPEAPAQGVKSSSLVASGYVEEADQFCSWVSNFAEHLTADPGEMIPPFRSRELKNGIADAAAFVTLNLNKWNGNKQGLGNEILQMQKKGIDLPIQTSDGQWIDSYGNDNQWSADEQTMMTKGMRSVILMGINGYHVRTQAKIDLLTTRKEWLTAKIIQEQAKLRGMDPNSPEYKKLAKITAKYAAMVSKYEQQIERMRG